MCLAQGPQCSDAGEVDFVEKYKLVAKKACKITHHAKDKIETLVW